MRHRMGLSVEERQLRSQLHRLLEISDAFIHGSLIEMRRCCGHAGCRCVLKGEKHRSLYLSQSQQGHPRMKAIPRDSEAQVRRWAANYQKARRTLEALSALSWQRILAKKKSPARKEKGCDSKTSSGLR
jgi:hypothetical protein